MANGNTHFDIAMVGSSLQAGLIAGLLAREHQKRVCLFIDPSIQHRLTREINFSVDCITRPETWQLLSRSIVGSSKLLTSIGGGRSIGRVNPLFVCNTDEGADALAHMYHVARGTGYEIERLGLPQLPNAKTALRFRGVRAIERRLFWPTLVRWLLAGDVEIRDNSDLTVSFRREGQASIKTGTDMVEVDRVILADEAAIMSFARPQALERHFGLHRATSLLTEPVSDLPERFIINPEGRFSTFGLPNNSLEILGDLALDDIAKHIGLSVPGSERLRRAGQSVFNSLLTNDGAPLVGGLGRSGAWAIAGFGHFGVFLAPAIARAVVGKSLDFEKDYFTARGTGAARRSDHIRDFQPTGSGRQDWLFQS